MAIEIKSLDARPDLLPVTAHWRWDAFFSDAMTQSEVEALEATSLTDQLMPTVLVLLENNVPIGMVAICEDDLENRPDLNPWLAGLFVDPNHRGRGLAKVLIAELENLARSHLIERLTLYTSTAEKLYESLDWHVVETFERDGRVFSIMQKHLN